MYTEGHVVEIQTVYNQTLSFKLEPVMPYKFRFGEPECTLAIDEAMDVAKNVVSKQSQTDSMQAKIFPMKTLDFTCQKSIADFASLVAIKAAHSRIGVEFNENKGKSVSKIVVL